MGRLSLGSRADCGRERCTVVRVLDMENFLTMASALTSWVSQPGLQAGSELIMMIFGRGWPTHY